MSDEPDERPPSTRAIRRRLVRPSGVVLAASICLPIVPACGTQLPAIVLPWMWPPYLAGALAAALASTHLRRTVGHGIGMLIALVAITAGAAVWGLATERNPEPILAAVVGAGGVVFISLATNGTLEGRAARAVFGVGALSTAWFVSLVVAEPQTIVGVYVGLGASVLLTMAGLVWWLRAGRRDSETVGARVSS